MPEKNWLEWSIFAVGLVLVASVVGYLSYDAWTSGSTPPLLEVQIGKAELRLGQYVVPVKVINKGDQPAESVHVEVALERPGDEAETADFELAFVPRRSTRAGAVAFRSNPQAAQRITARVVGYQQP